MRNSTKKKITITIDCDLYNSAKSKYDNISGRINELLSMDLYGSDEKSELIERLHKLQTEEHSITKRICELEREEVALRESKINLDKVLSWAVSVSERYGFIGLNKLADECKRHSVDYNESVRLLDDKGIKMVKFA